MSQDQCQPTTGMLYPQPDAEYIANMAKALADTTRVRLLRYVASSATGTTCACHLPQELGITQPTMSFHMNKLHKAGLITREKRGRWMHYTINPNAVHTLQLFLSTTTAEPGPHA